MKQTSNVTLSIPKDVIARMHKYINKGNISRFTTEALNKALDELQRQKENELSAAYESASKDKNRELEAKEWNECDIDNIQGWEWYDEK